jgi:asparagine synthase (glutamine-hydrolysing)
MAETIRHRGPDDGGIWFDAAAGIGVANRRLAIVDLSPHGHQPMVSASGRYVITFNGEIYNFRALREEVEVACPGLCFRGHSDTEVLLAAIERWGVRGAVERTVGMFGFALWDRHERTLTLGRDRLGEKPLYYGWHGNRFVFASELKAIRALPDLDLVINRDALALYFRHMYIPAPHSIYVGIRKLPPGCLLTMTGRDLRDRRIPEAEPYWSALEAAVKGLRQPFGGSEDEAVEELSAVLRQAVAGQMVADVPVGVLLSGGIDSSVITALMRAASSGPVKSFTIGSTGGGYDESAHARAVAQHLGTDHTELIVTPEEAQSVIARLPSIYDEPFADPSQLPTLTVSELARGTVTVALSGDGGDELFGGYSRHLWAPGIWNRISRVPQPLRTAAVGAMTAVSPSQWDTVFRLLDPILPRKLRQQTPGRYIHKLAPLLVSESKSVMYHQLVSYWDGVSLVPGAKLVLTNETDEAIVPPLDGFAEQMMFLDMISFLPDDVLVKVDRAAMAVSLETRAPLLDHRVVELALSLPISMKLRGGRGKHILRRVLAQHVPPELFERPKAGFGLPVGDWLRGPLREWSDELLSEQRLASDNFVRPDLVRQRWAEHLSGRQDWTYRLWSVLMFQSWLERETTDTDRTPIGVLTMTGEASAASIG